MNIPFEQLISFISLLTGGCGLGAFFTWKYTRRKVKAEAIGAEADATKEVQDVYQQMIIDVKSDREELKQYISELKDDRRHLRDERDELRKRQDVFEDNMRDLQRTVARNGRIVEAMRPFMCGKTKCPDRVLVNVSSDGDVTPKKKKSTERTTNK